MYQTTHVADYTVIMYIRMYIISVALLLHRTVLTVFLFGVRGFATGFFQAIYLYTPEVC